MRGGYRGRVLGLPGGVHVVPVRPRRGPDRDGEGPRRRVEADVRRLPARARGPAAAQRFVPFDAVEDYDTYVDGRPRYEGVRVFLGRARDRRSRRRARRPPDAETIDGLGNRKNEIVLRLIRERGVEAYEGSVALRPGRARRRPATCGRLLQHELPRRPARGRHRGPVRGEDRRGGRRARAPARQAGSRHLPRRARRRSASTPQQAAVFEDALAGVQAGAPGGFGCVVGVDRVGQAERCASTAPTSWSPTWTSCSRRDPARGVRASSRGRCARRGWSWTCSRRRESVFALSNGHIGLRGNLDEGEPHGLPGTYLNWLLRARAAAVRRAGYGVSARPARRVVNVTNGKIIRLLVEDEPFDVRYGTLPAHERVLDFRAGVLRRTADWISPAGARVRVRSARLVSFVQRAVAAISLRGRAGRRAGARRRPVRAGRQRDDADRPATRAAAAALGAPLRSESSTRRGRCGRARARDRGERPADGGGMEHVLDGPDGHGDEQRGLRRRGARDGHRRARSRASAAARQVARLRLVRAALGAGGRDQVRRRRSRPRQTGWDGLLRRAARLPRRLLGARGRRDRAATTSFSSAVRFVAVSLPAGRSRAPSSAGSRPRG